MSLAKSFGAPYVVLVDGESFSFPILKMKQIAKLSARLSAERVDSARREVKAQKLPPQAAALFISNIEGEAIDIPSIRAWATTPNGILATLQESLQADPEQVIEAIGADNAHLASLRVLGWMPTKEEGKKGVNPTSQDAPSDSVPTDG